MNETKNTMKTYKLPFQKVSDAISYDQLNELRTFDNLNIMPSVNQLMKRMDLEMFEDIIFDLEDGVEITIES